MIEATKKEKEAAEGLEKRKVELERTIKEFEMSWDQCWAEIPLPFPIWKILQLNFNFLFPVPKT